MSQDITMNDLLNPGQEYNRIHGQKGKRIEGQWNKNMLIVYADFQQIRFCICVV